MIVLHAQNENNYKTNGLGLLDRFIIAPNVHWEMNGEYSFEFDYPLHAHLGAEIVNEMQVEIVTEKFSDVFRIKKIEKSMGMLSVYCEHKSYDLIDNFIEDINLVRTSGDLAVERISAGAQYDHPFRITSTIERTASARMVRMGVMEALLDDDKDNSFINRWGGEIYRHYNLVQMHDTIGKNRGVSITHRKDLVGYNATLDHTEVVTRIRPIGKDAFTIPELYVDSPLIGHYPHPKIKEIKFDVEAEGQEHSGEEALPIKEAEAELRRLARLEYSKYNIDKPKGVYEIDFVALENMREYEGFEYLQEVHGGDTVEVIHEEDGLNIFARVMEYDLNPLTGEYTFMRLGEYTDVMSVLSTIPTKRDVNQSIENNKKELVDYYTTMANGKNKVLFSDFEPTETEKQKFLIGDMWYQSIGDGDKTMHVWNGEFWEPYVSTTTIDAVSKRVETVEQEAQTALETADEAVSQIDTAVENAGFTSLSDSLTGIQSISNTAQANAQTALSNALSAIDDASLAKANAQTAINRATDLAGQVSDFELTVDGFNQTINNYEGQVSSLINDISGFESTVASYEIELDEYGNEVGRYATQVSQFENTVDGFQSKVDKVEKDYKGISGTVAAHTSEISNLNGEIALKANTTAVNALTGRVSAAETGITSNANAIKLKASQSSVDAITGKVNDLGAQIDVTAGQISSRVWNTDIQTAVDGIEVGGRNLLKDSEREFSAVGGREFLTTVDLAPVFEEHGLDEVYSLSLDLKSSDISNHSRIRVYMQNGGGTKYLFVNSSASVTEEYQRFKFEGLKPSLGLATEVRSYLAFYGVYDTGNFPIVRRIKLEKGNKATDWSPAPEDTAEAISHVESQITQTQNMIDLRTTNDASGNVTSITLTDGSIISRVNNNKIHLTDQYFYGGSKFITDHVEATYAEMDNLRVNNTIDASKVRVINLDALNITANKTSFVKSVWNSLSSVVEIQSTGLKMKTSQGWDAYLGASGLEFRAGATPISTLRASLGADGRPEGAVLVAEPGYHSGLGYRRHDGELRYMIEVDNSRTTSTNTEPRLQIYTDTIHTDYNSFMVSFTNVGRYFYAAPGTLDGMSGIYIGVNLPYAKGHAGSIFYSIAGGTYALAADKNSYKRLN